MRGVYEVWAPQYRAAGFDPRPVTPDSKACHLSGWQDPMSDAAVEASLVNYSHYGIALLMGTVLPDDTRLVALDIDNDAYTEVGRAVMGRPPCVRFGSKGAVIFARAKGESRNLEFRLKGELGKRFGKHAEVLALRKIVVIPPTIHPDTQQPYRWEGGSLLNIKFEQLPILEF